MTQLEPPSSRDVKPLPKGYAQWLADVKRRVRTTQSRSFRAVNEAVVRLYWSIGRDIVLRQEEEGWGAKVLEQASRDLRAEFPGQRGFSRSNLYYMRAVAEAWPDEEHFVHQVGGQLPWRHITVLLDRLGTGEEREWYATRAAEEGWSRNSLEHWIKVNLRERVGAAPTNFAAVLDSPDSDLAQQILKDPFVFEHLSLVSRVSEKAVEDALMDRLQETLTEFGRGMAFVGRQVRLAVTDERGDTEELTLDLLLFHIPQRRYVVVELKTGRFQPGYVGQLGTYVALVDAQLRDGEHHAPTVGILLCTARNEAVVRFALASTRVPMGVADFEGLPTDAQAGLPSAMELLSVVRDELAQQEAIREANGSAAKPAH